MAGTIRPNDMNVATTPTLSSATLPSLDISLKKPSAPRTPRIDVEPLYSAVKCSISDADWTIYKKTISFFLLGNLNQEEMSRTLKGILNVPALEHAHNALVTAIYANTWRDAPDPGIASWVSSADKVSSGTVKGTGDESEKRLKGEVMGLSRRERRRLKGITNDGVVGVGGAAQEYVDARRAKTIDVTSLQIPSGGGFGKTNWDIEIRKRYTSALSSETHEFPTATSISHRLLPICYESGLPQGHTPDCPEILNIATETFIKEALASLLSKVSQNGPGYVRTGSFKKKFAKEERAVERGELQRGPAGDLPIEADERRTRKLLCMEDLRLALELGDGYLGQTPFIAGSIMNSRYLDTPGMDSVYPLLPNGIATTTTTNGVHASKQECFGDSWTVSFPEYESTGDPMQIDTLFDETMVWQGGSVQDVDELNGTLDDILSFSEY
ncbi:hypothetical protein ACN47E_008709 [Coniothyrium glycines]